MNKSTVVAWVSILALSGTLAFGMHQSIVRAAHEQLTSADNAAQSIQSEPNMSWILLSSTDRQGTSRTLACIAPADHFGADALELDPAEMNRLAAQLRCRSQP